MQMFLDIVRQSLATLWAHKLRSFLTMFGIAWGVGSLLLLVGLGEGFRSGQEKNLKELGSDILFCFPGRIPAVEGSQRSGRTWNFSYADYLAVRDGAKHVRTISPVLNREDIRMEDLLPKLISLRTDDPDLNIIVRGDAKTKYKQIRSVLDLCQQANVPKLELATEVNK